MVGQRLLAGVALASTRKTWATTLCIADPPPDDDELGNYYDIHVDSPAPIIKSMRKANVVRALVAAGMYGIAHRAFPKDTASGGFEGVPQERPPEFVADDSEWLGYVYELLFPISLQVHDGPPIRGARMRFGVARELAARAENEGDADRLQSTLLGECTEILRRDREWPEGQGHGDHGRYALVRQGRSFIADLTLLD
jgi:hypothetical protein